MQSNLEIVAKGLTVQVFSQSSHQLAIMLDSSYECVHGFAMVENLVFILDTLYMDWGHKYPTLSLTLLCMWCKLDNVRIRGIIGRIGVFK